MLFRSDCKRLFKSKIIKYWQNEWHQEDRNCLHKIKPIIEYWPSSIQNTRPHEVTLCRLRIGHTRHTHSYRMSGTPPPMCQRCDVQISIEHLLIECPNYSTQRTLAFGRNATLKSILSECDTFNINAINNFLKAIKIIDLI